MGGSVARPAKLSINSVVGLHGTKPWGKKRIAWQWGFFKENVTRTLIAKNIDDLLFNISLLCILTI